MITVLLYGHLREKFGRKFKLAIQSPAEAVRALCTICPGFKQHVIANSEPGYRVLVGNRARDRDELHNPMPDEEILKIVPAVIGGGPMVRIVIGVILVIVSYFCWGATYAPGMAMIGAGLIVGGVVELVFAPSKPKPAEERENTSNAPSYSFDGAVNVIGAGGPIPICYGRLIVGSQVVSAGLAAESVA